MSKAAQGFLPACPAVCGEAYFSTSRAETRRERRAGEKWPFMDGYYLIVHPLDGPGYYMNDIG